MSSTPPHRGGATRTASGPSAVTGASRRNPASRGARYGSCRIRGIEEGIEAPASGDGVGQWNDHADVQATGRHRVQNRVVRRAHVNLPAIRLVGRPRHVRHEGHSAKWVPRHEAEPSRHHGVASVGADHQPGPNALGPARGIERLDARHPIAVHDEVGHAIPFSKIRARGAEPGGEDPVERRPWDREGVIAVPSPPTGRRVGTDDPCPVRPRDGHAPQRDSAGTVDGVQHPEPVEDAPFPGSDTRRTSSTAGTLRGRARGPSCRSRPAECRWRCRRDRRQRRWRRRRPRRSWAPQRAPARSFASGPQMASSRPSRPQVLR